MTNTAIDIKKALARTHAFIGLEAQHLELIEPLVVLREYETGDTVVEVDSRECDLLLVLEGELRVNDIEGDKIADLGPGSSVGEVALLDQQPRCANVIATMPTVVAVIPALELWLLMESRPELGKTVLFNIGRVLASRLRSANCR